MYKKGDRLLHCADYSDPNSLTVVEVTANSEKHFVEVKQIGTAFKDKVMVGTAEVYPIIYELELRNILEHRPKLRQDFDNSMPSLYQLRNKIQKEG